MYNTTKNNLLYLATLVLSIISISAMEKESTIIDDSAIVSNLKEHASYERMFSKEIDAILKDVNTETLNNFITEPDERTETLVIDDEEILPLLQKPCNAKTGFEDHYPVSNVRSLIIKTEYCDPYGYLIIEKGVYSINLQPTPDKKLKIIACIPDKIINKKTFAESSYGKSSQAILAQLKYNDDEKALTKMWHRILNQKIAQKLGYDRFPRKVLAELQIIYPHHLVTIENKFDYPIFLNATDTSCLTSASPYASVKEYTTKKFLVSKKEKEHQTITFPEASNTVQLPINALRTHFIIKHDKRDDAAVINAESKETVGILTISK